MIEPRPVMRPPNFGDVLTPESAMTWALILARRGAGFVSPNPMVGCVIVDADHKFIAGGWHRKVGEAHAEVEALDQFALLRGKRENVAGCHLYVTLEPCAHEGRTGSCAKMLAPLKPASVTYAIQDPNPLVAGKGAKILNEAGVATKCLAEDPKFRELVEEAEDLVEIFLWSMRNQGAGSLPFITVKIASSLDGRVAMHSGESKWITGEQAREKGHRLRLEHDAVIVGRRTVETDNPSLNVRLEDVSNHVNSVVVVDPKAKTIERLMELNLAKVRPPEKILVCVQKGLAPAPVIARGRELGFNVFEVSGREDGIIDLREMLVRLREQGLNGVYVEGGAGTVGPFFDLNLIHRLHLFMAPSILGGRHAVGWSDLCGDTTLKSAWALQRQRVKLIGQDLHITGRLETLPS